MNKIVEAVIRSGDQFVPVGLVSIKQALEMPEKPRPAVACAISASLPHAKVD